MLVKTAQIFDIEPLLLHEVALRAAGGGGGGDMNTIDFSVQE